jgi:hypothetical protein
MCCLPPHLRVWVTWWLLLPSADLDLGKVARGAAPTRLFACKYFNTKLSTKAWHMMILRMTNSLSCTMQVWEGQDTMPTTLWTWNEAEQVTGNVRHKY